MSQTKPNTAFPTSRILIKDILPPKIYPSEPGPVLPAPVRTVPLKPGLSRKLTYVLVKAVFVLGIAASLTIFETGRSQSDQAVAKNPDASVKQVQAASGVPVRLKIPGINVDAVVETMGVTPNGDMEAYMGPRNVGWYKFGVHPGDTGSAVIAGHYGRWQNGLGSVFDDLNKLRKGDRVYVEDENGATTTFVVRESRDYDSKADVSAVFKSNDGSAHLNLITCEGLWNEKLQGYSKRLVVFADRV